MAESERLTCLTEATRSCGWWWPQNGAVILTDRATDIRRDAQGRLHSEHGPALAYGDGYCMYAWHGVTLQADPDQIRSMNPDDVLREANTEVRRSMIEIIGWSRFIKAAGLKQVGKSIPDPGNPGETLALYDVPNRIYEADVRVLICTNATTERDGSRHTFGLTVPANISDPLAAAAWTFNVTPSQYSRLQAAC
jgi:hypothetical protein